MSGWISIDRALLDHNIVGILKYNGKPNHDIFVFWVWLICNARYEDGEILTNGTLVKVRRGQYFGSLRFMSDKTGLSMKKIRNILKVLKKGTAINVEKGTGQTLITILKYNDYQRLDRKKGTAKKGDEGTTRAQEGHSKGTKYNKGNKDNNNTGDLFEGEKEPLNPYEIKKLWNKICAANGTIIKIAPERKKHINARIKDSFPTLDDWEQYFKKIAASEFLTTPATWNKFDWYLNLNNVVKILEGNYDNKLNGMDADSKEDIWNYRLGQWKLDKWNEDKWGFPPDNPHTEVPARILREFNTNETENTK